MRDPAVAKRLLDVRRSGYLAPFLGTESSVAAAARILGVSIARMAYQTDRLVECGLVRQTRVEPRAGRPVKHYRAVADEFVVPLGDVSVGDLEQYLLDADEPLRRQLARSAVTGLADLEVPARRLALRVHQTAPGGLTITASTLDGDDLPVGMSWGGWLGIMLDRNEAAELVQEVEALWERWRSRAGTGPAGDGKRLHLLHVATGPADV